MNEVILIVLFVCGVPDTYIVKHPNEDPIYTHNLQDDVIMKDIIDIMVGEHILIKYEDSRAICA